MNLPPILLHPNRLRHRCGAEQLRRRNLGKEFGVVAARIGGEALGAPPPEDICPSALHEEWRRAIAEELLLAHACKRHVPGSWVAQFGDVSPFGNEISLTKCLEHPAACGVFPLATQSGSPGIGHVWVLAELDRGDGSGRYVDSISRNHGLCFVATHQNWHGESWQLAARMASRCLECSRASPDTVADLAAEWLITGRVEGGRTKRVELGNKFGLANGLMDGRSWLIPLDNIADVPPTASLLTIRSAVDEEEAWSHVTGQGVVRDEGLPWPTKVGALHILVGGNIKAPVVSALFSPPDTAVHLWRSQESTDSAAVLARVLATLRPDLDLRVAKHLDSHSLVDAERSLRDAVGARHGPPETIMLNVTSGNLLMRLAADAVARVFPNVVLVYRDINALPFLFTRIDYQQFPHKVGTYEGHKAALDGLDADFLFGRQKYEAGSVEATAEEFLKAVRPNDT